MIKNGASNEGVTLRTVNLISPVGNTSQGIGIIRTPGCIRDGIGSLG
jgi:hypothetical protein